MKVPRSSQKIDKDEKKRGRAFFSLYEATVPGTCTPTRSLLVELEYR